MPEYDELQAALLEDHWDALVAGRGVVPGNLDRTLARIMRELHDRLRPPDPDPAFVTRLRAQLRAVDADSPMRTSPARDTRWIVVGIAGGSVLAALSVAAALLIRSHRRTSTHPTSV